MDNVAAVYNPEEMVAQFVEAEEPDEEELKAKRQRIETDVKENIEEAQKNQKLHSDRKHAAGDLYTVGSQVLKKDFLRKKCKGGKMDYLWLGPYVITFVVGKRLYRLKEVNGNKVRSK